MTAVAKLVEVLQADGVLSGLLPGGIHQQEISRQTTAAAFDANSELLPCAYVRAESLVPAGPHDGSARMFVLVFFYQQDGYNAISAARRQVYTLLHRQRFSSSTESIYQVAHADDLLETEDPALHVSMERSRYQVTIQR